MQQKLLYQAITLAARGYQTGLQREDDENGKPVWVAFVPEMPSCFAQGDTVEGAIAALKTVREDYIYFLLKHGVPVPEPTPREATSKTALTEQTEAVVINSD